MGEVVEFSATVMPRVVVGDHYFIGHSGRPCEVCGLDERERWHLETSRQTWQKLVGEVRR